MAARINNPLHWMMAAQANTLKSALRVLYLQPYRLKSSAVSSVSLLSQKHSYIHCWICPVCCYCSVIGSAQWSAAHWLWREENLALLQSGFFCNPVEIRDPSISQKCNAKKPSMQAENSSTWLVKATLKFHPNIWGFLPFNSEPCCHAGDRNKCLKQKWKVLGV